MKDIKPRSQRQKMEEMSRCHIWMIILMKSHGGKSQKESNEKKLMIRKNRKQIISLHYGCFSSQWCFFFFFSEWKDIKENIVILDCQVFASLYFSMKA